MTRQWGVRKSRIHVPSSAWDSLHGLPDVDIHALQCGDGLVHDSPCGSLEQNASVWQEKSFWFEDAVHLSISGDYSAEERLCRVFRYANTLTRRKSDQKLRLRMSQVLLHLEFESLTRDKQSGLNQGTLENPGQYRAATLSIDDLLKLAYPCEWDSYDGQTQKRIRSQFHEQKGEGSRWWQAAGTLGLGVLLAGGDTLAKVMSVPQAIPCFEHSLSSHEC